MARHCRSLFTILVGPCRSCLLALPLALSLAGAYATAADAPTVHFILTYDAPDVRLEGAFERIDADLSRSAKVLHGVGGGPHRIVLPVDPGIRGHYRLFAWWPRVAYTAVDAEIRVHPLGTRASLGPRAKAGQWNSVGIFELPATGAAIEIVGSPGAELIVDSFRLQYISAEAPPLSIETNALPIAVAGLPYEAAIEVIGNIGAPRFAIDASQLPAGLTLDPASGTLAGVPEVTGHYEFDVEAFDGNGQRAQRRFALEVTPTPAAEPSAPADAKSGGAATKDGVASGTPPNLANLIGLIAALPEGGWAQASLNSYSSAWTPPDLRPLVGQGNPDPMRIILAWSGFAWDPNRGDLLLFGGGHANYSGNDVYRWRGTTRRWERAALPSEVKQDSFFNWPPIDGWDAAPASAHTYDNNIFFPHIDRLVDLRRRHIRQRQRVPTRIDADHKPPDRPVLFQSGESRSEQGGRHDRFARQAGCAASRSGRRQHVDQPRPLRQPSG